MSTPRPTIESVAETLRAATPSFAESWSTARFLPATDAERGDRTIIAASRTVEWEQVPTLPGYVLRPYGVHQHTLIVGFEEAAGGVRVDVTRLSERTW